PHAGVSYPRVAPANGLADRAPARPASPPDPQRSPARLVPAVGLVVHQQGDVLCVEDGLDNGSPAALRAIQASAPESALEAAAGVAAASKAPHDFPTVGMSVAPPGL